MASLVHFCSKGGLKAVIYLLNIVKYNCIVGMHSVIVVFSCFSFSPLFACIFMPIKFIIVVVLLFIVINFGQILITSCMSAVFK